MEKWLSVFYILLSVLALQAKPIHVALLGSPAQLVDLLQAELSESKELALLERREIDKIMQERKLAELSWENLSKEFPHTDVFVVLSENSKGKNGRVLSFNAKNGARLMDMSWRGNPYEHVVRMSGEVKSAAAKQIMDGVRYLAMTETRFVNVMNPMKGKCVGWRQLFEQNLLRQNEIQLLERKRLDMVLAERRLTEESHELSSSGHLVGIEFEGRGRADEIHCKVICMDVTGKKQFAVEAKDILAASGKTAAELAIQFNQALAKAVIDMAVEGKDRKAEAAKYFKIYNTFDAHYIRKNPWALTAAVALDPDNPVYRYQELADFDVRPDPVNEQWLERANHAWKLALKFRHDFPDINIDYLPRGHIFFMASAVEQLQRMIKFRKERKEMETVKELNRILMALDGFYRKYRPYVMEDYLRSAERIVFDDGKMKTNGFRKFVFRNMRLVDLYYKYGFYVDEKERANDYLQSLNSWLEPENAKRRLHDNLLELYPPLPWKSLTTTECLDDFLKFAKENNLVEKLSTYQSNAKLYTEQVREEAFRLDFFIKTMEMRTMKEAKAVFKQFLETLWKKWPPHFSLSVKEEGFKRYYRTGGNFIMLVAVARKYGLSEDFVWECLEEVISELQNDEKPINIEKAIQEVNVAYCSDESIKTLMPYVPQFKQDVMKYLTDEDGYYDLLWGMSQISWSSSRMNSIWMNPYPNSLMQPPSGGMGPILTPPKDEFFTAVNEDAKLKYGPYSEFLKTKDDIILHQACRDRDNLLLLLEKIESERIMYTGQIIGNPIHQEKPKQFTLISLHPDLTCDIMMDSIILPEPKNASKHGGQHLYWGIGLGMNQICQMACNPSFIVIGNRSVLWVLDRKTNALTATIHIPVTTNMEIAMTKERLYILSPTRLMSMNFQGDDRQVIFDTERLDAKSEMDKKGQASGLQLLPDGRLMFLGNWKIWICNADGSELKSRISLPYGKFYALYDGGEGPLLSASDEYVFTKNTIVYRIDVDKEGLTMIAQTPKRVFHRSDGPITKKVNVRLPSSYHPPYNEQKSIDQFIVKNGWLFQGHVYPLCVNISAPEKSPFLWLPVTYKLLSIGDRVMFMRNNCWFLVDAKSEGE